jgi:hypothetical protein
VPPRTVWALGGLLTFGVVGGLLAGLLFDLIPMRLAVPLFVLAVIVSFGIQVALMVVGVQPPVQTIAARLMEGSEDAEPAQWSVGHRGQVSPLRAAFQMAPTPWVAPVHGWVAGVHVTIHFERIALAGPLTVPLTVVGVSDATPRDRAAAWRIGADLRARPAEGLLPGEGGGRTWSVAWPHDAQALDADALARLGSLWSRVAGAMWVDGSVYVIARGHVTGIRDLRRLVRESERLAGRGTPG